MSEQQLERLTNLVTNPYTWLFLIFAMSLPYLLKYIRRFYPSTLREKMDKEEACTIAHQKKPEMQFVQKILVFGLLFSIVVSYVITYQLLSNLENSLRTFQNIFLGIYFPIMLVGLFYEHRIAKNENCNDVIVGYKYLKFPNIILIVTIFCLVILGIFYLIGTISPPQSH